MVLLVAATPLLAREKKLAGKVADSAALLKLQSFCIDSSSLNPVQVADLDTFLKQFSKPGRLLSKLPWKLAPDCASADAVASFVIEENEELVPTTTSGGGRAVSPGNTIPRTTFLTTMTVMDRASGRMLYEVRGDTVEMRRDESFISPFTKLMKDLKRVRKTSGM